MHCTEITHIEQLPQYADAWRTLLAKTPHASFFQSIDWLQSRWRFAEEGEQLIVIVVHDNEQIVGFVPLSIQQQLTKLSVLQRVGFPHSGWSSFYGPVTGDPNAILQFALEHLRRSDWKYDSVELENIPDYHSPSVAAHVEESDPATKTELAAISCREATRVAMLDLCHDWDTYWESRRAQKNRRRNVERCERRLAELGTIRHERYRPPPAVESEADLRWDLYDACENLARVSWQHGLVDGNTMHHDEVRSFLRDVHVGAVTSGAIDMNVLYLDDEPIAFVYGYHYLGYLDLTRIGFHPKMAKLAPGNALWTRLIKDSYLRGDRVMDFGPTCLDYKQFWTNRLEPSYALEQYTASPKSLALQAARWAKRRNVEVKDDSNQRNKKLALENHSNSSQSLRLGKSK